MNHAIVRTNSLISRPIYRDNSRIFGRGLSTVRSDQIMSRIKDKPLTSTESTLKDYEVIKLKKYGGFYQGDDPKFVGLWSGWNINSVYEGLKNLNECIKEIELLDLMKSLIPYECNYEKFFEFCWKSLILQKTCDVLSFLILHWLVNKTILDLEKEKAQENSKKNIKRIIATLNNLKVIDQLCIVRISDLYGIHQEIEDLSAAFEGSQKTEDKKHVTQYHPHEDIWKMFSSAKDDTFWSQDTPHKVSGALRSNIHKKFEYEQIRESTDIFCEIGLLYKVLNDKDEVVPFTCTGLYTRDYSSPSKP